jgi:hypothetical protein
MKYLICFMDQIQKILIFLTLNSNLYKKKST